MAYTQKPGRTPFLKTGNGIPSALMQQIDPETLKKMKQDREIRDRNEAIDKKSYRAEKAVDSYKSNKKLGEKDLLIERAAARDSIDAANPKDAHLFTSRQKAAMGHKSAEETRKLNNSSKSVEKKEVFDKKLGFVDKFKTKTNSNSPMKQKVSKKTAYDIKEASNQKLKPSARKHYAENAQAAMKNKKKK